MSNVSTLGIADDYMYTYCPACGERFEVDEEDECATLPNGNKEYELWCKCGCHFYSSVDY